MFRFKNLLTSVVVALACTFAAQAVTFEVNSGINNDPVRRNIEQQTSRLLTAINDAQQLRSSINYSGINIDELAKATLNLSWAESPFKVTDNSIVTFVTTQRDRKGNIRGYQVRGITVMLTNSDYTLDPVQEISLDYDNRGNITDFNFTMPSHQYAELIKKGVELDDLYERMLIIHWCEQLADAYHNRNMAFMEDTFSDDALIIVGKRKVKYEKTDIGLIKVDDFEYNTRSKKQYLANLANIFKNNKYIQVEFTDYSITRHGSKPQYYGVTLTQKWRSGNGTKNDYQDLGTLFLVWDFSNPEAPQIHVRTWTGIEDPRHFSLRDFKLP